MNKTHDYTQRIEVLTKGILMPKYGTKAYHQHKKLNLPMTIERKEGEQLETFMTRVEKKRSDIQNKLEKMDEYGSVWVNWKTSNVEIHHNYVTEKS